MVYGIWYIVRKIEAIIQNIRQQIEFKFLTKYDIRDTIHEIRYTIYEIRIKIGFLNYVYEFIFR